MRSSAIDAAVAAVNPVAHEALGSPRVGEAGAELLEAIFAQAPCAPRQAPVRERGRALVGRRRRRWLRVASAAALAGAIVGLVLAVSGGPTAQSPAFGAELIRYADSSPLVLLQLEGWRVSYANEEASGEGEMHFLPAGATESGALPRAELHWRVGPLSGWVEDRAASSDFSMTAPVLGSEARVFRYMGGKPGSYTFTALWDDRGRVLEFRATVPDLAAFERMLSALHRVSDITWLSAMPASVITAAGHPTTVSAMLAGIPLPPGFDASSIAHNGLAQNRYQLGAAVAGTVACMWIARWAEGQRSGNTAEARAAIAAMASSPHWPVLHGMESEGAYPAVLEEYAAEMPSGSWHGHPLAAAASAGLGCPSLGVPIPLSESERSYGLQPVAPNSFKSPIAPPRRATARR